MTQGRTFVGIGALKLAHDVVMLSSPFILQRLLQNLQDSGSRCAHSLLFQNMCLSSPSLTRGHETTCIAGNVLAVAHLSPP